MCTYNVRSNTEFSLHTDTVLSLGSRVQKFQPLVLLPVNCGKVCLVLVIRDGLGFISHSACRGPFAFLGVRLASSLNLAGLRFVGANRCRVAEPLILQFLLSCFDMRVSWVTPSGDRLAVFFAYVLKRFGLSRMSHNYEVS